MSKVCFVRSQVYMVQAAYGFIKNSTSLWVLSKHVHLTQHSYFKYMNSGSIMVSKHSNLSCRSYPYLYLEATTPSFHSLIGLSKLGLEMNRLGGSSRVNKFKHTCFSGVKCCLLQSTQRMVSMLTLCRAFICFR